MVGMGFLHLGVVAANVVVHQLADNPDVGLVAQDKTDMDGVVRNLAVVLLAVDHLVRVDKVVADKLDNQLADYQVDIVVDKQVARTDRMQAACG